jgi:phosphoribosyl 1,2-cyclic phosphodiesterase
MTEMRVASLASGSKGNAYLVEQDGEALLVDCGLSFKVLKSRLEALFESNLPRIHGVLLTHSHSDHVSGLRPLISKLGLTIYANSMTAEAAAVQEKLDGDVFACFENNQTFEVGPFQIESFPVPHDTSDPVGYTIRGNLVYFHATDVGVPLDSIGKKLVDAEIATLESNHDCEMLKSSARPYELIRRISGPRGHLSNDESAELVRRFASPRLKKLALAHLSQDCNEPHLALAALRDALNDAKLNAVALKVLSQNEPVWI